MTEQYVKLPSIHEMFEACRVPPCPKWIEPVQWGVLFGTNSCHGWVRGRMVLRDGYSPGQTAIVEIESYSSGLWGFIKRKGIE